MRGRRPASPLPQREGLDAICWTIPPSTPSGPAHDLLLKRFPPLGDPAATPLLERFEGGDVVRADGTAIAAEEMLHPGDRLWFHRELADEDVPDIDLPVLLHDEHLLVIDKPHDVATMPRGAHVRASALARLRRLTGITTLVPLHRLDRRTAGVLAFGIVPSERAAYQQLFARGAVRKHYEALVEPGERRPTDDEGSLPRDPGTRIALRDRLIKPADSLTVQVVPGEPNAHTAVSVRGPGPRGTLHLDLEPHTGRTHQLRIQLSSRGAPIRGEDLYPEPRRDPVGPLQLLARRLAFTDPVTGQERRFTSTRTLSG
ncbi:pseudouridine synthase [Brachybacterium sp. Marseille-Q7125]|uniref:pseudouridine synthase n=1 Tax=Brachybacterium sp. Marseille-Q7125 TaxID=2932815 RepID=UPI001FF1D17E